MRKYKWISKETALIINRFQITKYGGSYGIRDEGLLISALTRPKNIYEYDGQANIFELTAAYGFGIIKNHAFIDGNKRTGYVAMELFLRTHNIGIIRASESEKYTVIMRLATGEITEKQLANWLNNSIEKCTSKNQF